MTATQRLTAEQVATYHREGYLLPVVNVFPDRKFQDLKNHFEAKLAVLPADQRPEGMASPHFTDPKLMEWLLADEVLDLHEIAVYHVAAGLAIGAEDKWFHHHGHAIVFALEFERADILNALVRYAGRSWNLEKIHAHTGRIESDSLKARLLDHRTQRLDGQLAAIDIRHIRAENEGWLLTAWDHLQVSGLPGGELNGVRSGFHDGFYGLRHILDACEKARLIEKSVIDGDIEATAGF